MNYVDVKFLNLLSSRLLLFKKKSDYLWNFRCPVCGDSQKSKSKARGFVFRKKNELFFKCHNCHAGMSLMNFIKTLDSKLYDEYIIERYKSGVHATKKPEFKFEPPKFRPRFEGLKSFAKLSDNHPALDYIRNRKIPEESWERIFFCPRFYEFTNGLIPNKFPSLDGDHPRMIIPFFDENKKVFAYQGRAFGKERQKYITIILDPSHDKLFGLDKVNWDETVYVTEGPIDSLFLDNAIAVAQSDLRIDKKDNVVLVPDNEPRNPEIVKQIKRCIDDNYAVVLWPHDIQEKDVNDMILSGQSKEDIMGVIRSHTYSGLEAQMQFVDWKKV